MSDQPQNPNTPKQRTKLPPPKEHPKGILSIPTNMQKQGGKETFQPKPATMNPNQPKPPFKPKTTAEKPTKTTPETEEKETTFINLPPLPKSVLPNLPKENTTEAPKPQKEEETTPTPKNQEPREKTPKTPSDKAQKTPEQETTSVETPQGEADYKELPEAEEEEEVTSQDSVDYLELLAQQTGTPANQWKEVDGPESNTGVDFWFINEKASKVAYINNDQGDISISIEDQEPEETLTAPEGQPITDEPSKTTPNKRKGLPAFVTIPVALIFLGVLAFGVAKFVDLPQNTRDTQLEWLNKAMNKEDNNPPTGQENIPATLQENQGRELPPPTIEEVNPESPAAAQKELPIPSPADTDQDEVPQEEETIAFDLSQDPSTKEVTPQGKVLIALSEDVPVAQKQEEIKAVWASPRDFPPIVLIALGKTLFEANKTEEGTFWTTAGLAKATQLATSQQESVSMDELALEEQNAIQKIRRWVFEENPLQDKDSGRIASAAKWAFVDTPWNFEPTPHVFQDKRAAEETEAKFLLFVQP